MDKLLTLKNWLRGSEAIRRLKNLTGVALKDEDFFSIINNPLPAYVNLSDGSSYKGVFSNGNPANIVPADLQRVRSHFDFFGGEDFSFSPPPGPSYAEKTIFVYLRGMISEQGWSDYPYEADWAIDYMHLWSLEAPLVFLTTDVEDLAAKMNRRTEQQPPTANNEPAPQSLQEENQRLKQEIETLKAEVERLAKEAAIAPPDSHGLEFNHATRHLELVSKVQQEFYDPEKFDAKDPNTRPKKDVIIHWLTSQFEVSQTDANAIERVATPFDRGPASK